jgi:hypothetical protein
MLNYSWFQAVSEMRLTPLKLNIPFVTFFAVPSVDLLQLSNFGERALVLRKSCIAL